MTVACTEEGCLIASEGICARSGGTSACEKAVINLEDEIAKQVPPIAFKAQAEVKEVIATDEFVHAGTELGIADTAELMCEHATFVIGIVGFYGSGKTSFLNALYLLASCGGMAAIGYAFAGSLTLPGFEERARASRKWAQDKIPDSMSVRTKIAEGRSAGFMHIDLSSRSNERIVRLLLSDIPGEWASDLVNNARHATRFSFLNRSDAIFMMVEGSLLMAPLTRHAELHRQEMLLDRISEIAVSGTPVHIVLTKADEINMIMPPSLSRLATYAEMKGFRASVHVIASLSKLRHVASGTGVLELLANAIERPYAAASPSAKGRPAGRSFGSLAVAQGDMQ
jgi:hypothetical protein